MLLCLPIWGSVMRQTIVTILPNLFGLVGSLGCSSIVVVGVGSHLLIMIMGVRGRLSKAVMGCSFTVVIRSSGGSVIAVVRCCDAFGCSRVLTVYQNCLSILGMSSLDV